MSPATYQTVKLSKGKHISPEDGACVMEMASMLAGEPFSDHPACACPVIGSFLRAYNDSVDDERRQDLYALASKVVGSRSTSAVQRARAERKARDYERFLIDGKLALAKGDVETALAQFSQARNVRADDPELAARYGRNARARFEAVYAPAEVRRHWLALLGAGC